MSKKLEDKLSITFMQFPQHGKTICIDNYALRTFELYTNCKKDLKNFIQTEREKIELAKKQLDDIEKMSEEF